MSGWESQRFGKQVHLTHHALRRMEQRGLSREVVMDLIETGTVRQKDAEHWWICRAVEGRPDNHVCAAVLSRQALIVKTLMTHWEEREA